MYTIIAVLSIYALEIVEVREQAARDRCFLRSVELGWTRLNLVELGLRQFCWDYLRLFRRIWIDSKWILLGRVERGLPRWTVISRGCLDRAVLGWAPLGRVDLGWPRVSCGRLGSVGLSSTGLGSVGPSSTGLGSVLLSSAGLDSIWLKWATLDTVERRWCGLDSVRLRWSGLHWMGSLRLCLAGLRCFGTFIDFQSLCSFLSITNNFRQAQASPTWIAEKRNEGMTQLAENISKCKLTLASNWPIRNAPSYMCAWLPQDARSCTQEIARLYVTQRFIAILQNAYTEPHVLNPHWHTEIL
jgi:hypothetical protein